MVDQAQQAVELLKGIVADPDTLRLTTTYGTAALTAIGAAIVFWKGLKLAFHAAFGGGRVAWWIGGGAVGLIASVLGLKRKAPSALAQEILTALTGATLQDDGVLAGNGVSYLPQHYSRCGLRLKTADEYVGVPVIDARELRWLHRQCDRLVAKAAKEKAAAKHATLAKRLWADRQPKVTNVPASWVRTETLQPLKWTGEDCPPESIGDGRLENYSSLEAIDAALQAEAVRRRSKTA